MLECNIALLDGSYGYATTQDAFARSFPFYCTDSGMFIGTKAYYTKRDNYNCYLLIATLEGCGKLQWNGQKCLLERGSAVVIDCSKYHEYATVSDVPWRFYYLSFQASSMEGYRDVLLSALTPMKLRTPTYVWQLMEQIYKMSHQTDVLSYAAQSNAISNLLTEMLYSLAGDRSASVQLQRPDITTLAEYIREHCTEPLTLELLSKKSNLSKHHMLRMFRRQVGMPPGKYLHLCRVNRAQILLRSTDMTVTQITHAVGYHDPVVFIRHFRDFNQTTPLAYRKASLKLHGNETPLR